eukprot:SAG31_NODE_32480_length_355_cov_0.851562_2_plen_41_part_01
MMFDATIASSESAGGPTSAAGSDKPERRRANTDAASTELQR